MHESYKSYKNIKTFNIAFDILMINTQFKKLSQSWRLRIGSA